MIIVRALNPKLHLLSSSIFRDEIKKAAEGIRKDALKDFERTTATWNHKPKFTSQVKAHQDGVTIEITTDDKIYGYVDQGTKPHVIQAHTDKGLVFTVGGSPKTEPHVVQAFPGKRGDKWVRKMQVKHPGTAARKFSEDIAKSYKPEFQKAMRNAIERFARRQG
jgi:lipoprotein-anchoring transpeptidase ErfK/SrfK